MATWSDHIGYFGSPAAYAKAIKEKESKGQSLSDPAAAAAFKQSHPEYFGGGTAGSTAGGTAGVAADLTRQLANLKMTYEKQKSSGGGNDLLSSISQQAQQLRQQGASEAEANKLVYGQEAGWYPGWAPGGGGPGVSVSDAVRLGMGLAGTALPAVGGLIAGPAGAFAGTGMQQSGAMAGDIAGGMIDQARQGMPLEYAPQGVVQPPDQFQFFLDELYRLGQDINIETAPILSQAYGQVIDMIANIEQSLIQRYAELGQGVDPATQAALASLKETVNRQREGLMEEMSRRGLLQSGLWLEMEGRLSQGLLTEQQQLMANRLSDLQNQLNQALLSLGQARIQATSQYGLAQVQAAEAAAQRKQQALTALAEAAQKSYEQMLQQQREEQKMAWEREKAYMPWTMGATPAQMLPYQFPTASALLPYELGPTPAQMLPYQYPTASSLVPYEYGLTPYQEQQLSIDKQRLAQARAQAGQPNQADITRQNMASAQTEIWGMLNSGVPIEKVEEMIWKNAGKYTQAGLNASDLVNYAWQSATGYPKPKSQYDW